MPKLAAFYALFAAISSLSRTHYGQQARVWTSIIMGAVQLLLLHNTASLYVVIALVINFYISNNFAPHRHGSSIIWVVNIAMLMGARLMHGVPFSMVLPSSLAWLGGYRGPMRWEICFNLTVLRMLSYGLDQCAYHSSSSGGGGVSGGSKKGRKGGSATTVRQQSEGTKRPSEYYLSQMKLIDFSLLMYLSYALYPPLYLAGPIITFRDYVFQIRNKTTAGGGGGDNNNKNMATTDTMPSLSSTSTLKYALRFAADLICLEVLTHILYFNSLAKYKIGRRYQQHGLAFGSVEVGLTGWWVLCFMWLKFATIWRFTRLASLVEGLDPPENMLRCIANNYDVAGFWRGWHSSFNRWLVQYMYVPLGGSKRALFNIWPIFFFVAIWHDFEWRLLAWAWVTCLAFLPELLIKKAGASEALAGLRNKKVLYRHVCAGFAAVNIAALMSANLAGFVVGLDGLVEVFIKGMLTDGQFVAAALLVFYSAAHIMFYLRETQ
jgi:D-alanyl-lipoteichoic acid acyltransferase DltB (MBOAT superfamily)